ncbi:hypothetical protein [Micromonospora sp. WMMD812]|uniref:hypothetical protein n=1 Tax=Micromonospora sp. WMMD812 TaxID=3015152 RepID=UPI00248C2EC4|nr:hypothetical protein [Micromonospora sp. WMMD812]WBB65676.1 hypothetical protein O7603_21045 [Micromonospora sp. WMMD812]
MIPEHIRDAAATAVVFGFFASSWYGWAQEAPPRTWRKPLVAGSIAALVAVLAGGLLTWRHWSDGTAFTAETSRNFGIVVGIEFGLAALGAGILAALRRRAVIPAWIALIVGVHLFPVAALIGYPLIHVVGALITLIALAAVPLARKLSLPVSAVTGLGTGTVLLAAAVTSMAIALLSY